MQNLNSLLIIKNLTYKIKKYREKRIKEARFAAEQEINLFRKEEEERYKKEIEKVNFKNY